MTIDRILASARPVNLQQLTLEVRAALGDDAITGLSADRENIIAHFTATPTDSAILKAAAAVDEHVPQTEAQQADIATIIESATTVEDLKAALLSLLGKQ